MITARPPANEFPASVAIEALGLVRARANEWASDTIEVIQTLGPEALAHMAGVFRTVLEQDEQFSKGSRLEFATAIRRERLGRLAPGAACIVAVELIRKQIMKLASASAIKLRGPFDSAERRTAHAEAILEAVRPLFHILGTDLTNN